MIEVQATSRHLLGMPAARFLRDYWQKKPLLIRQAFPDFVSPIEPEDLAGLACEELALARIVSHDRQRDAWTLRSGPFAEDDFPGMPDHDWTLLVQDVDKWDADVRQVLQAFDFLPRWRIDDVMVSFAASGGSVGAHVDQYDVFLLQAQGRRHWQVDAGPNPPTEFRDDAELRLLRQFHATHEWVLEPGDMLYLPPGVPHHGVAMDPCLTMSIGMRAPSSSELIGDYLDYLTTDADEALRYQDPDLAPPSDPNLIDDAAMARAIAALNALRVDDPDRLGAWFGRFITTYRAAGEVVAPEQQRSRIELEWDLQQGGRLLRHPFSRMAWRRRGKRATLFCSGLQFELSGADAARLAGAETLDGPTYSALGQDACDAVFELHAQGHYQLEAAEEAP